MVLFILTEEPPKIELAKSDAPEIALGSYHARYCGQHGRIYHHVGYVRQIKTDYATWAATLCV